MTSSSIGRKATRVRTRRTSRHRATARMRQVRLKGVTNARARSASDEEGARWSFQTRDDCPWEMDIEGREGRFSADGCRHRNIGGSDGSATDTTGSTDTAFYGAGFPKRLMIRMIGILDLCTVTITYMVVRNVVMMIRGEAAVSASVVLDSN